MKSPIQSLVLDLGAGSGSAMVAECARLPDGRIMLLIGVEQDAAPRVDEAIGQAGFGNEVGVAADLRSLAARVYRGLAERVGESVKQLVQALDRPILSLRICGGGGWNAAFCRLVANIFGRPIRVGPIEATAWGNAIVQLIALGAALSLDEGRRPIEHSLESRSY